MAPFIDAKVIVSTYEELPRRRRNTVGNVAPPSAATTRAKASAPTQQVGGYSRRALLLAYAQQLRHPRRGGARRQQIGPPLLEWGKWKTADRPVLLAGGDDVGVRSIVRRGWCSGLRCRVRLWIRAFLGRIRRISEDVSCNKGDQT